MGLAKSDALLLVRMKNSQANDVRPIARPKSPGYAALAVFHERRLAMRMDDGTELVAESAVVDSFGATTKRSAEQ